MKTPKRLWVVLRNGECYDAFTVKSAANDTVAASYCGGNWRVVLYVPAPAAKPKARKR